MTASPEIEITKPVEQWSNGLMVHYFKYGAFHYKVMQRGWKSGDPEETTVYIDNDAFRLEYKDPLHRVLSRHPLKYGKVFDGLITPLAAAKIVEVCDASYTNGYSNGYADAQRDIRKALGIT